MLARAVRSGVAESYHDGAIAAIAPTGDLLLEIGDIDRPFFYRSAIKPFQATVAIEAGATLNREQTALACASHGGQPVHVAIVADLLEANGLDVSLLQCPPARPPPTSAPELGDPEPVFYNCSGKHAAALVACAAQGWPLDTYMDSDHPYQLRVGELVAEASEDEVEPVGVDGCGFPTLRGTVRGLARAFARLSHDDRYDQVREAMSAMPALTSDWNRPEAAIASWLPGLAKGGAVACAGVAVTGRFGLAGKCWDGSTPPLYVGLIAALERLGVLEPVMIEALMEHARPPVLGGDEPVGFLEPALSDS